MDEKVLELQQQAAAEDPKKAQPGHWVESLVCAFGHGQSYQLRQLFVPIALGTLAKAGEKLAGWQQQQLWETLQELAQDQVATVRASLTATLESSSSSSHTAMTSSEGTCIGERSSSSCGAHGAKSIVSNTTLSHHGKAADIGGGSVNGKRGGVSASMCSQWDSCAADAVSESLRILNGSEQLQQLLERVSFSATQEIRH
jgi:hypothetical protein